MKLRLTVGLLWLAGVFAVVCYYYPVFKLREVVVAGNSAVPTETVASLLDAAAGDNLLRVDLAGWVDRVVQEPAVARARAYVTLTGKAVVRVEEVSPDFLIDTSPIAGLTRDGEILPLDRHPAAKTVPLISGIGGAPAYYTVADDSRIRTALHFYTRWEEICEAYANQLAEIHVSPEAEISIYLWPKRRYITIGRGNWDQKLTHLWTLLRRLPPGVEPLDMRFARQVLERS